MVEMYDVVILPAKNTALIVKITKKYQVHVSPNT